MQLEQKIDTLIKDSGSTFLTSDYMAADLCAIHCAISMEFMALSKKLPFFKCSTDCKFPHFMHLLQTRTHAELLSSDMVITAS